MRLRYLGLIPFLLFGVAKADEALVWAVSDSPPFFIFEGRFAGEGFCDQLIVDLRARLPEYQHEIRRLPHSRIIRLRQQGAPLCFPCMIKKTDGHGTIYSGVTNQYPPHQVITNRPNYRRLVAQYGQAISLKRLLRDTQFSFGYPLGRKYGDRLQPLFEQYSLNREDHLALTAGSITVSVLKLVSMGRLDYNIDYPAVGRYFELVTHKKLYYLPITENQGQIIQGAVGCSDTPWGRQVIDDINRVLPGIGPDSAYRRSLAFWLKHKD